jgi:hypothetical protein
MKKELLYPFFIDCSLLTNDKFWKSVFEDLAYGIAPYGAFVNKGFIMCNYKDKEFVYKIVKKDPKELYNDIYNLFTTKLNIISSEELSNKKREIERFQEEMTDWSFIKKKNSKDAMIENWAISMKNKHSLSLKQTKYLISIVFLALVFKVITSKDIVIKNNSIESVNGISFENGKVNLEKDIYNIQVNSSPDIITDKANMSDEWPKYLSTLRKN